MGVVLDFVQLLLQSPHLTAHVVDITTQFKQYLIEDFTFVLERAFAAFAVNGHQLGAFLVLRNESCQYLGRDNTLLAEHRYLLRHVFQLAHVARPFVAHQHLLRLLSQHHAVHLVFLGHLHGKQPEQQHHVLTTLTQRRHLDGYGIQAVVKIFTELALADGLTHVDIRGSHNPHVGLANLSPANRNVFSCLKHTQQSGLCS